MRIMRSSFLLIFVSTVVAKRGLPPDIKACRGTGQELDECIQKTGGEIFPRLFAGELKSLGLGDINPIQIPRLAVDDENEFLPGFRFELLDTEHRGWKHARILRSRAQPDKYSFEMSILMPEYEVKANKYDISGRLLFFDVKGTGKAVFTFYNNTYHVDVTGEPYERKGKRFMRLKTFNLNARIDDMHIKADGLFGFQPLNEVMVDLLNRNSKTLVKLGEPMTPDLFGPIYSVFLGRLFDSVPYDDMFPDAQKEDLGSLKSALAEAEEEEDDF